MVLLTSCNGDRNSKIHGEYKGYWGDTEWTIDLKSDYNFIYKIDGHAARRDMSGLYKLSGDTIILMLNDEGPDFINGEGRSKKLLNVGDSCLVDLDLELAAYDYCKVGPDEFRISRIWNLTTLKVDQERTELGR